MVDTINIVLGLITIGSFVIAVWQHFESRYYQKINESSTKRINQLMKDNQELLQKIGKETMQTLKHKDIAKIFPNFSTKEKNLEIKKDINNALNPIKDDINNLKKELKSNPHVIKQLKNIGSKIQKAGDMTFNKTFEELRIESYLTIIDDFEELKLHIGFFEWLKEYSREFIKETEEIKRLTKTIKFERYTFPTSPIKFKYGIPYIIKSREDLLKFDDNKATLSPFGLKILEKMKGLLKQNFS